MANYNKDYMAAYKQYGQTMTAGGGGSNMSGTGSSTMQVFNATRDDNDKPSKGLAAKPTTTTKEDKPSFWDRITSLFQDNEVDVTNVYKPSVDPAKIYNQSLYTKVPEASDYVYRADMSERTQDMVEQAMGYEKPQLGQLQLLDTGAMTEEEQKQFAPLIKLADDIRNNNITSTELPSVLSNNQIRDLAFKAIEQGTFSRNNVEDDVFYQKLLGAISSGTNPLLDEEGNVVQGEPYTLDQEASLMDALMEGQPTAGLMSRPSSFTGGSVDVASNIPNWMQDLSAAELTDVLVGINQGTHDPETGQRIQSAEDVAERNTDESQGLMSGGPRTRGKAGDPNKAQKSIEGGEVFNARDTQRMLNELGDTRVAVDGTFGPNSRKALGKYQASIGLPATGVMDRATLEAMRTETESGDIEGMDFQQDTVEGQALAAVEDLTFNPYILNTQARLRDPETGRRNRRHNSGLTIGTGMDIGQKDKQDLLNMGVSEKLATKLDKSGWLGLNPSNAVEGEQDYYRTAGHAAMVRKYEEQVNNGTLLTLSPEEIDELVQAEYDYHAGELEKAYEDSGYGSWDDLSQNAKAALTVERYHKGNLGSNWRTYFERARNDDVRGITELYLYEERGPKILRALGVS